MTVAPSLEPAAKSPPDTAWARARYERHLARLDELADMAMAVAADMARQVKAAADQAESGQAETGLAAGEGAMAFGRAARAVRLTVLLQGQLIKAILELDNPPARKTAAARDVPPEEAVLIERTFFIPGPNGPIQVDREGREIGEGERLDRDDVYAAVRCRPAGELVAEICETLGVEADWPERAEEQAPGPAGARPMGFEIPDRAWPPGSGQTLPRRPSPGPDG